MMKKIQKKKECNSLVMNVLILIVYVNMRMSRNKYKIYWGINLWVCTDKPFRKSFRVSMKTHKKKKNKALNLKSLIDFNKIVWLLLKKIQSIKKTKIFNHKVKRIKKSLKVRLMKIINLILILIRKFNLKMFKIFKGLVETSLKILKEEY
jgi:hypothetical protein